MNDRDWYVQWFDSPFYHKLYFERDAAEAEAFIQRLLQHLKLPPGSRLLDVGCGRGRHSRMLSAAGYLVTGIDLSENSILFAKQSENERLRFYRHDMRLPLHINYYNAAFNFFTSFGYFATRREHDAAMRTIAGSLQPGGTVVFDYLNVHYAEDHLVPHEVTTIGETVYDIHRWHDDTHFYKRIHITDPTLEQPQQFTEKVAKFSLGDFTDMMAFQGLQVTEVFGNYHLDAYHVRQTPRMIVLARK